MKQANGNCDSRTASVIKFFAGTRNRKKNEKYNRMTVNLIYSVLRAFSSFNPASMMFTCKKNTDMLYIIT